jgi:precorrin-8X/cobalt-precorrin-8 methylmutase
VQQSYPFITALGRKGGTPVAVAAVNALLRLA